MAENEAARKATGVPLGPRQKQYLIWGLAAVALVGAVLLFGGAGQSTADDQSERQQSIQGILEDEQSRDVSIGSLSERLDRLREDNQELRSTVEELESQTEAIDSLRDQVEQLADQKQSLRDKLEALHDQRQQRTETPQQTPPTQPDDAGQQGAEEKAKHQVDTSKAFGKQPQQSRGRPATAPAGDGQQSGRSGPKIRVIETHAEKPSAPATEPPGEAIQNYLPTGTTLSGRLLSGLDAPTNQGARENTTPALVRVKKTAIAPNYHRGDLRECFILMEGFGELSSERVKLRANTLSCVRDNDTVLEVPLRGYAVGEDGKIGLRGRLVSKQGRVVARSMMSGFAAGVAKAFDQTPVPTLQTGSAVSGETEFQSPNLEASTESGAVKGASKALNQVADFYLDMAKSMFPVIEVSAARRVDIVLTSGVDLRTGVNNADGGQ